MTERARATPGRGGDQQVPRPLHARSGESPPWAGRTEKLDLSVTGVVRAVQASDQPLTVAAEQEGVVPSAVLAAIYPDHGEAGVVLTRRAWHLRDHKGEVAFPGGKAEPQDPDLAATALRESHEEVALPPDRVRVVGELDHLMTFSRRSYIVPYVGVVDDLPPLVPEPGEVERVLEVPLAELLAPETYRQERWDFGGAERVMHFFDLVDDTVWGATAAMLYNLLGLVTGTYGGPDWHARGL